ncbi:hypothetical protein LCGC14_2781070 [marine sediment metagenome]|uniref:Uncharacterized protein n=1 Tax=marine sediment metagenome TaxID=412755 RepID=A0A0F8YT96_9ZZZZ
METITRQNGNGKDYAVDLPKLHILNKNINDAALDLIEHNTGLRFKDTAWGYAAQPETSSQIATLIMTYNFKTQYHNNADSHNTLYLKFGLLEGFKVEHVCYDCCEKNHINVNGLTPGDRLTV